MLQAGRIKIFVLYRLFIFGMIKNERDIKEYIGNTKW